MSELLKNLGQIGGLVAIALAVWALVRDQRRKQVIDTQGQLYDLQKEQTALSEKRREDERKEFEANSARERQLCDAKIHELQGRLSVLESTWGQSIGEGVAIAVTAYLREHLDNKDGH